MPLLIPFQSAKTNQEGSQIVLTWTLTTSLTMEQLKYFEWQGVGVTNAGADAQCEIVLYLI